MDRARQLRNEVRVRLNRFRHRLALAVGSLGCVRLEAYLYRAAYLSAFQATLECEGRYLSRQKEESIAKYAQDYASFEVTRRRNDQQLARAAGASEARIFYEAVRGHRNFGWRRSQRHP